MHGRFDDVAAAQETGRSSPGPYAGRGAGVDQIARKKFADTRQISDDVGYLEDHVVGLGVLHDFARDAACHLKVRARVERRGIS